MLDEVDRVVSASSAELASDPPLCAEDRETNTKRKCLPVAAELLAARGAEEVATHE
jgi:hypothetical protein